MTDKNNHFVRWFRNSLPYINAFRGRTFVIVFGGEMLADAQFSSLIHDIALLNSLGVRLVLVHGARPQIEQRLRACGAEINYVNGLRITDDAALSCVKEAVGSIRIEIEALLSMGLSNSPMDGACIRIVSGNFITAQPLGIREGVDYCHTGEVRRIDTKSLHKYLQDNTIVLLSPLATSPSGEIFNLSMEDVATNAAIQLRANKLIHLVDGPGIVDGRKRLLRELTLAQAEKHLTRKHSKQLLSNLSSAMRACNQGVPRAHLINRNIDGALLLELFTRDGIGTLITSEDFEGTRQARIKDIGGILEIIIPLEEQGILVRRSREQLELEIDHFNVVERDGMIIACSALYPYSKDALAELACLAIHPDYQDEDRGTVLLHYMERKAIQMNIKRVFVLTTRSIHWFRERGFKSVDIKVLPVKRLDLYNYRRNSKVFIKDLVR